MTNAPPSLSWPGLRSERLVLRPWVTADAPLVHALCTRPDVARMLFMFRTDWTVADVADFIGRWQWTGGLKFRCAILHEGVWAGWIGVDDAVEPEIFYAIDDAFRGRGVAREAVAAFAGFLFARFGMGALTAGVFADNPASGRVLEACGFVRAATGRHGSAAREGLSEAWTYRLTREAWLEGPAAQGKPGA